MKRMFSRPTKGQFITVWEYTDQIWALPFKWEDGVLMEMNSKKDGWEPHIEFTDDEDISNVEYFVK